jgi:hypothetical protein
MLTAPPEPDPGSWCVTSHRSRRPRSVATAAVPVRADRPTGSAVPADAGHRAAPRRSVGPALARRPTWTPECCGCAGPSPAPRAAWNSASPRRTSPGGPSPSPARPSRRSGRIARQEGERHAAGSAWRDTGLVFTTETGTALEPRNVLRRFEQHGVHPHTLRHSAASFLLAAGTHTKVVQEHLGHSSYAITADICSHVDSALSREAADRLDQALRW